MIKLLKSLFKPKQRCKNCQHFLTRWFNWGSCLNGPEIGMTWLEVPPNGWCKHWEPRRAVQISGNTFTYPSWVCYDCGLKYGRKEPGIASWHPDTCGICGEHKSVTEPRDFGHLRLEAGGTLD